MLRKPIECLLIDFGAALVCISSNMYLRRLSKRCRALLFVLPSAFACSVGQCVSPLLAQGSRRPRFVVFASLRASSRMAFGRLGQYRQLAASSRLRLAASLASLLWLATAPPLPLLRPARAFSSVSRRPSFRGLCSPPCGCYYSSALQLAFCKGGASFASILWRRLVLAPLVHARRFFKVAQPLQKK